MGCLGLKPAVQGNPVPVVPGRQWVECSGGEDSVCPPECRLFLCFMNALLKQDGLHGAHLLGRDKYTHSPYCRLDSLDKDWTHDETPKKGCGEGRETLPDLDLSKKD